MLTGFRDRLSDQEIDELFKEARMIFIYCNIFFNLPFPPLKTFKQMAQWIIEHFSSF
jgi:hypothetical protein